MLAREMMVLSIGKMALELFRGLPAHLQKREQHVESVEQPRVDVRLRLHAGRPQMFHIGEGLGIEGLGGAHKGVGGRQPGIVLPPGGRGVAWDLPPGSPRRYFAQP